MLEPVPASIREADLMILIDPDSGCQEKANGTEPVQLHEAADASEFNRLGLRSFCSNNNDSKIDWEEQFGLK